MPVNSPKRTRYYSDQTGVGLIEVLMALVVFALGVVGLAGLQLKTLSLTMDSSQRTYAMAKSQDLADRIRGGGFPVSDYNGIYTKEGDFCGNNAPVVSCSDEHGTPTNGCTTGPEMAAYDLYETFCAADGSLEEEVVDWQVTIDCTPTIDCSQRSEQVNITTTWTARTAIDRTDDNGDTVEQSDTMTLSFIP